MKTSILVTVLCMSVAPIARASDETLDVHGHDMSQRTIQLGGGVVIPYRVNTPSGRSAILFGVSAEYFISPYLSLGAQGIIGVEHKGFTSNPVYIAPGVGIYPSPGQMIEPFIRADAPILLNNGNDYGARGGLGVMWNTGIVGLGFKYSFDAAYYFRSKSTILDLANVSAVFNW